MRYPLRPTNHQNTARDKTARKPAGYCKLTSGGEFANHGHHVLGGGSCFERFEKIVASQHFGYPGQGVEMPLELPLGYEEKGYQVHGLVIEGIKIDPATRPTEGGDHFGDDVGGGMGNTDAETDAGAHRLFTLLDDVGHGLAMLGRDASAFNQDIDQLVNGFPPACGLQFWHDLPGAEYIAEVHDSDLPENHRRKFWLGSSGEFKKMRGLGILIGNGRRNCGGKFVRMIGTPYQGTAGHMHKAQRLRLFFQFGEDGWRYEVDDR